MRISNDQKTKTYQAADQALRARHALPPAMVKKVEALALGVDAMWRIAKDKIRVTAYNYTLWPRPSKRPLTLSLGVCFNHGGPLRIGENAINGRSRLRAAMRQRQLCHCASRFSALGL